MVPPLVYVTEGIANAGASGSGIEDGVADSVGAPPIIPASDDPTPETARPRMPVLARRTAPPSATIANPRTTFTMSGRPEGPETRRGGVRHGVPAMDTGGRDAGRAGVPAELHVYEKGGHGIGLRPGFGPTSDWPKLCGQWLQLHGWIAQP